MSFDIDERERKRKRQESRKVTNVAFKDDNQNKQKLGPKDLAEQGPIIAISIQRKRRPSKLSGGNELTDEDKDDIQSILGYRPASASDYFT